MTEELKVVMEAIQSLGADGKQAFIWWLIFRFAETVLTLAALFTAGVIALKTLRTIVFHAGTMAIIKHRCGVRGEIDESDRRKILNVVDRGLNAQ